MRRKTQGRHGSRMIARAWSTVQSGGRMIILGVILLLLGFFFNIQILWILGIILLVVGVVLLILGSTGRAVGGRRHWF
jgi:uncharacterized membrane protein HdeD (DUF308 family)